MKRLAFNILIYSGFIGVVLVLTYLANYAMVYRIHAAVLSWMAALGSIGCVFLHLRQAPEVKSNKWLITAFAFVYLYSLHIVGLVIFVLLHKKREYLASAIYGGPTGDESVSFSDRILSIAPEIILLSLGYMVVDTYREYTVWHTISLRILPLASLGTIIAALLVVRAKAYSRKKA